MGMERKEPPCFFVFFHQFSRAVNSLKTVREGLPRAGSCHRTKIHKFRSKPKIPYTPRKTNMEPENDGFQEELPFLGTSFQVPC